jgi:hypothetical protein
MVLFLDVATDHPMKFSITRPDAMLAASFVQLLWVYKYKSPFFLIGICVILATGTLENHSQGNLVLEPPSYCLGLV